MKYYFTILAIFIALLLTSCATGPKRYEVKKSVTSTVEYDVIIGRITDYLSKSGFTINNIDKENGIINAEIDALELQGSTFSSWDGINVKYLLADCGKLMGSQNFADKLKVAIKVTKGASGNDVRISSDFKRTIGNEFPCVSTGELEKQFFHYIETGRLIGFPKY